MEIRSIEALEHEVNKIYLMQDKGVVRALCGTVIANQMKFKDPVWLLLVAPSSGGKTELINALSSMDIIMGISSLTVNTFASGMKVSGKETSLLHKLKDKIMVFKDFTSILSINKDAKKEIMAQLREIYDGEYIKRTGNGKDTVWRGKVGAIAGSTQVIYEQLHELSAMGDRFVMYNILQPERLDVARRMLQNSHTMAAKREHMKDCFKSYLEYVFSVMKEDEIILSPQIQEDLLLVADFATRVRSAVITDQRTGVITFVPDAEMPMRVTQQLYMVATGLAAMNTAKKGFKPGDEILTEMDTAILYKIALDSIPTKRRWALQALAKYKQGVSTAGLALKMNYETEEVKRWLYTLNSLGICKREKAGGRFGDRWHLVEQYRNIMIQFEKINPIDDVLEGESDFDQADDWGDIPPDETFNVKVDEIDL